ncbi:MAG: DUF6458 family protein [Trebonia sp.]
MKTGAGLAFIAVGAIFAFAVKGSPGFVDLHTVGWVLMLVGLVGMLLPRRTYGWLGRRMTVRRSYPSGRVEQRAVPPYVSLNPGTAREEAGLPPEPTLLEQEDLIDGTRLNGEPYGQRPAAGDTEVIEDLYEQP